MVLTYAWRVFSTPTVRAVSLPPKSIPPPFSDSSSAQTQLIIHIYPTRFRTRTVNPFDGRVVSNFIVQALRGEDLTVYGDGTQTRSFQYIHDLVDGLIALMNSRETRPVNLGNGDEFTIGDFAKYVRDIVEKIQNEDGLEHKRVQIVHEPIPTDDP